MRNNRKNLLLFLFSTFFFFHPIQSFSEEKSESLITGLSYAIIYPGNQSDKSLGYFDLTVKPGQKQKISLNLTNTLSEEITANIQINGAKTNSDGVIEYGPNALKEDDSLKYKFNDIVKGPKQVTIPAASTKQVDFIVSLSKETFNGFIAGGIQIQPIEKKHLKNEQEKDTVINEFAFLLGVLLRVGETKAIKPELKLDKTYVAFKEGRSQLLIDIANIQPVYVEDMDIAVQVRNSKKQKTLFSYEKKGMRMAPNSMIDVPIELADKRMKAGEYTAQITASTKDGKQWSWTDDFVITTLEANSMREQIKDQRKSTPNFLLYFLISLLLFLVTASYLIIRHKWKIKKK